MSDISEKIREAVRVSVKEAFDLEPEDNMVMVERPRDPKMGDYSTNIAMRLAKSLRRKPADIANNLAGVIQKNLPEATYFLAVSKSGFSTKRLTSSPFASMYP